MDLNSKAIIYLGSTKKDLSKLPGEVKETFAFGLYMASLGDTHPDTKALKGFGGRNVLEIIEDYKGDTYRAIYTVRFKDAIYVLHVFKKKSTKGIATPKKDRELLVQRLKDATAHYKTIRQKLLSKK